MSLKLMGGLCILVVLTALAFYTGVSSKPSGTKPATPPKIESTKTNVDPIEPRPLAKPAPAELSAVINRIYKDAVIVDGSRENNFTVGDFNGDDSQDIAILVRPVKNRLSGLNGEYANWIVQDPRAAQQSGAPMNSNVPSVKPAPVKIKPQDSLLTIVHGYQESGWRNPAATQTYLMKNSVGDYLRMEPASEARRRTGDKTKTIRLSGDVIRERLSGESGFLYWTGSRYAWQKTVD